MTQSTSEKPKYSADGVLHQAPAGYRKQSQDPIGTWDGEEPIHCIPRGVKLFDSNLDKSKPSILIVVELLDATGIEAKDEDSRALIAARGNKGDVVGIWYKPGMKPIANLADAKVWMAPAGERNIGKPSPMKIFDVQSPGPNKKLLVISDDRKESAGQNTPFAGPRRVTSADLDDDDSAPF